MSRKRRGPYWTRLLAAAYLGTSVTRVRDDQVPPAITEMADRYGSQSVECACLLLEHQPHLSAEQAITMVSGLLSEAGPLLVVCDDFADWLRADVVGPLIDEASQRSGARSVVDVVNWRGYANALIAERAVIVLLADGEAAAVYAGPTLEKGSPLWRSQ